MRIVFIVVTVTLACAVGLVSPVLAEQTGGHLQWESWKLIWEVQGNTGLSLRQVTYLGQPVLTKASVPVIRVKYVKERKWYKPWTWFGSRAQTGRCGPFQDRIRWKNLVPVQDCGGKVCIESYLLDGVKWLEIGAYARIGEYHLYQAWYLSEKGEIRPILQSRGLSCRTDHDHHAYWRLDFSLNGDKSNQAFVFTEGKADQGWGPGWRKYTNEVNDEKVPSAKRVWFVRDPHTGQGVWVIPGTGYTGLQGDGKRDRFSGLDVGVRRNWAWEDEPWIFGARGDLGYGANNDDIQEKDLVFWYVAHLPHLAALGPTTWLAVGPILKIQR